MSAYYNENDPRAAAWLRELIKANLIAPGIVDERSIVDVQPTDLHGYKQCHFFAGIGGWSYALRLAGIPDDEPIWTGSCPCQPFSAAGKQRGTADERHLWPEFFRLIRQCNPATIFGEQVASKAGRQWLAGIFADLEGMGYCRAAADLCAASVGAPHIRQRLYWVGHSESQCGNTVGNNDHAAERNKVSAGVGSSTRGVADATSSRRNGQERRAESETRDEARVQLPCANGETGGVADTQHDEWRPNEPGRRSEGRETDERISEAGRLANPDGGQSGDRGLQPSGEHGLKPEDSSVSGLGDSNGTEGARFGRDGGQVVSRHEEPNGHHASGAWARCELLPCADGKARRIEPSSFPLAHGIPGRVGLLRGYGNAIVPQVAAEFIQAFYEALHDGRSHVLMSDPMF